MFAHGDGVVGARMTTLEREWRTLAKVNRHDEGPLRDLWAPIAPPAWTDHPRYRESAPEVRAAAAVLLASDPEGVERAERAARAIACYARTEGITVGARVTWRVEPSPRIVTSNRVLFASARARVLAALRPTDAWPLVARRAIGLRREVSRKLRTLSNRTTGHRLSREVGDAAFIDALHDGAAVLGISGLRSPVAPFFEVWRAGYLVAEVARAGITLAASLD